MIGYFPLIAIAIARGWWICLFDIPHNTEVNS